MKLKNKLKEVRKKGFTLIELIVVIAVLGILVLLAAHKFLGYIAEAKLVQIQNDIKAHESQASVELIDNPKLGYARDITEVSKFNATSYKPVNLTFEIKKIKKKERTLHSQVFSLYFIHFLQSFKSHFL